jgi:pimeloyl-ACP methyl ester carboxylesterase
VEKVAIARMARATVDGIELAYEMRGSGDPVVLIHWGVAAAWAAPLLDDERLASRHRLLNYHRAGFGESGSIEGEVTIADHAAHCRRLMNHVGMERAHIVGHSSSAVIALQLALDCPAAVQTLVLMEAARPVPETPTQAAFVRDYVQPAVARFRAGDTTGAVETWCEGVFGPRYREPLEQGLAGAFDAAVADARTFFTQELPALQTWSFTAEDASRVSQPALLVLGENTVRSFVERRDLLRTLLPHAEPVVVPGATHLLHIVKPRETVATLAAFFARHPLGAPS